jgi:GT2 family glycosyltransferase
LDFVQNRGILNTTEAIVDVIVCTYNNKNVVDACLKTIFRQTYKNFRCYVIDDHSVDGPPEYVGQKYNEVIVYEKKSNTGPSGSRNIGLSLSKAKYVAFLDSDVELAENWLEECVEMMEEDLKFAICAPKLYFASARNKLNSAGGTLNRLGMGLDKGKGGEDHFFERKEVLFACSAAMLVRRESIKAIGGFDEAFAYGYEDADVGWRANISGYKVIFNPASVAYHRSHATVRKLPRALYYDSTKNRIRMLLKNYQMHNLIIFLPVSLLILCFDILFFRNRILKIKGMLWNIANLKGTLKERKRVQLLRVKKDRELFNLFESNLSSLIYLVRSAKWYRKNIAIR